ncbi:MAG TPA: glycosyltransferase family 2 protein [Acidimicrobiia bacterium]|nr:glycosyltransferase family 2 protein [Acidimicrobiia bacterium]
MTPPTLPSISVVTPSFNQGRFLTETMESIHAQRYPYLEHIVIDGGSSDESVSVIKRYEGQLAYWVSEPDQGQTDALIKGFARSTGDIQCWLNSDDLFEPGTLAEVGAYFAGNPAVDFVYGNSTWIDERGLVIKPKREHGFSRFIWMYDHNFIPQPSAFWRRELYERVGGLDPRFDLAMDADLWIRFADVTKPRHVPRPWSRMRFYGEQKNTRLRDKSSLEGKAIRSRYLHPKSRREVAAKAAAARSLRVLWKLASGAYSASEVLLHARTLVGGKSWEQQRLARATANVSGPSGVVADVETESSGDESAP